MYWKRQCNDGVCFNGISNNLFTSTYTYYIPNKEQLIGEVEKVLKNNDDMSKI